MKIRNIGISAHIDSGKTTLSERILFYTNKIHALHEVKGKDGVGATMDSMDLEREKGITIQSAATYCIWKDFNINLIDTPGHVDFTVEVERALKVLDGAVLVLCSVAGVQSQSITVDRQMKRYGVPRICFINKMDRAGANPIRAKTMLKEKLSHNAHFINYPIGAGDSFEGVVDLLSMKALYFSGENGEVVTEKDVPKELLSLCQAERESLISCVSDFDDDLANKYLAGESISEEDLFPAIRKATLSLKFTPVMVGSAYKNKGIQPLLDAVTYYLPAPSDKVNYAHDQLNNEKLVELESDSSKTFCAFAFKVTVDQYGQLTYVRVYQGSVKKGDVIYNNVTGRKVKVTRLIQMHADQRCEILEAKAGDIVAFFGVDCSFGDTFGDGLNKLTVTSMHVPAPVISLAIEPKNTEDEIKFMKAIAKFCKEDPTFSAKRDEESSQMIISGMGELHLSIITERMKREFDCEVLSGEPQASFREAILKKAEFTYLHSKQTGGRGQYAKIGGYIEPTDSAEFEFIDKTIGGVIPKNFITACEKGFKEAVAEGSLIGYPVIGVRVVIDDGAYHNVDSDELSFKLAAIMAFREAYSKANPIILEPIMKMEVIVPSEYQGTILGQVKKRRGLISGTDSNAEYTTIQAKVPLKEIFNYSVDLRSATQGKGEFTLEFDSYVATQSSIQKELEARYLAGKKL